MIRIDLGRLTCLSVLLLAFLACNKLGMASGGSKLFDSVNYINHDEILCGESANAPTYEQNGHTNRIFGGRIVQPGEIPFQVLIEYKGTREICGGVIIDESTILTAAHCAVEIENGHVPLRVNTVKIGAFNRSVSDYEQVIELSTIIVHPNYSGEPHYLHDIAIMKPKKSMSWKLTVDGYGSLNRICMPEEGQDYEGGELVTVSGWGRYIPGSNDKSEVLRAAEVNVVDRNHCAKHWEEGISSNQVCASTSNGRDSCRGDSGGPLFRMKPDTQKPQAELVGLVSYGLKNCGNGTNPTVYTRVSKYSAWISEVNEKFEMAHQ